MLTAKDLVTYGYFPAEIPPPFNTIKLGDIFSKKRPDQFEVIVNQWHNKDRRTNIPGSKCCLFSYQGSKI